MGNPLSVTGLREYTTAVVAAVCGAGHDKGALLIKDGAGKGPTRSNVRPTEVQQRNGGECDDDPSFLFHFTP